MVVLPEALPFRVGAILSQVHGTTTVDIFYAACTEVCVGSDSESGSFYALPRSSPPVPSTTVVMGQDVKFKRA
jgi:hypothetical protein